MKSLKRIYTYKVNKHWYFALYVIFLKTTVFHSNLGFFEELILVYVKNLIDSPAAHIFSLLMTYDASKRRYLYFLNSFLLYILFKVYLTLPLLIIIIIKKRLAMQGRERENSWSQKRREQLGQQKGIGPALETRQSHTIEYGVNQIVPDRYWEGTKSPAVLRGSAADRRISIPMCDQSTSCNSDWHIRHR